MTRWQRVRALAAWLIEPVRLALRWTFRLFNLLEPDVPYPVLSISKIAAWGTTFSTLYITIHNPQSEALAGSVAAQTAAMANYAYRRWVQYQTSTGAYAGSLGQAAPEEGQTS